MEQTSSNKRLAKNTFLLYIRTFLMMLISLYTSRVILDALGIENYGIYNIVGGFVAMFSIVSGTLTATTQRYLTFEIGKRESSNPQKIFGASMTIHLVLIAILLVLFETIGLWFLNTGLNIPQGRISAANWVYQCSIATFLINIISAPYTATIIAHEKMSAFAYISLIEVSLKLIIVYLLYLSAFDKLVVYAILLLLTAIAVRAIYSMYCHRKFPETRLKIVKDKSLYKEMFSFASMNFLGAFASIVSDQGVNILLNLFFGVTINAARGIAIQVQGAVMKFVNDFTTAINPQITKTFASGDYAQSMKVAYLGAKFSFFLLLLITPPLFFRIEYILDLWLVKYPEYAVWFIRLTMICTLITVLSNPIITVILSTGHLKSNALWIGGTRLLILPLCYVALKLGNSPIYAYCVVIVIEAISLFIRLAIVKSMIHIPISAFVKKVLIRITPIAMIVFFLSFMLVKMFPINLFGTVGFACVSIFVTMLLICFVGLTVNERTKIVSFALNKIRRK